MRGAGQQGLPSPPSQTESAPESLPCGRQRNTMRGFGQPENARSLDQRVRSLQLVEICSALRPTRLRRSARKPS